MRKIQFIVVAILLLFFYISYKNITKQNEAVDEKTAVEQLEETRLRYARERIEMVELHNKLRVECEKGRSAHSELIQVKETSIPQPDCGLVISR